MAVISMPAVVQSGIVRHTVKFDECSVILCYKIVFYLGR
jgi:hypothetical protein